MACIESEKLDERQLKRHHASRIVLHVKTVPFVVLILKWREKTNEKEKNGSATKIAKYLMCECKNEKGKQSMERGDSAQCTVCWFEM